MPLDYDCVIIGAGYVGAALALALDDIGIKVTVIDRRAPMANVGTVDARGIALSPSSKEILSDLGLWASIAKQVEPVRRIRVSERGRLITATLDARDVGIEALANVVPADYLLGCMETALLQRIDVRWQTTVTQLSASGNRMNITVRNADGIEEKLAGQLVVGADGVNSMVRELLGIAVNERDYGQSAIVAQVTLVDGEPQTAYERFTADGPLAMLPVSRDRWVVIRCCQRDQEDELLGLSDDAFIEQLTERFARPVGTITAISKRHAHPLKLVQAAATIGERAVLVGAAAVAVHPNAAQGLNLGLRDVVALCNAIAEATKTNDQTPTDIGAPDTLNRFVEACHKDRSDTVRFTDLLASGFASRIPGAGILRSLGMLGVELLPALKRSLIYRGIGAGRSQKLPRHRTTATSGI